MTEQTGIWSRFKTAVMQPNISQQSKINLVSYCCVKFKILSYLKKDLTVIKREVSAFEEMGRQLFLEIVDLNRTLERIHFSKTFQGKYFNFMGYFFSIYCVSKILLVYKFLVK